MGNLTQQLIDGINIIVDKKIKKADYARIRTGLITSINADGTYNVIFDSKNITNVPFIGSGTLSINSTVRVVIPDNQPNQAIILGTTVGGSIVSGVTSVNGMTGDVAMTKSTIGLGNVDNTSDVDKPISIATQNALNLKVNTSLLATVATTGSYNDLSNKPIVPTKTSDLTNDSGYQTSTQVASNISIETSNRQTADNDLQGQITSNDTDILNLQNTKANITDIPTKISELTNDSGFLTSIPTEYVTDTEMQAYAQPIGDYATNTDLGTKLPLSGGTMTGAINMGGFGINNLPDATTNQQPVTFKQLSDAISGLGNVFDLKGALATVSNLPTTGNAIGDVWYVESESVGYIWLQDTTGTLRWEKFGQEIDLSGYMTKAGLLQTIGSATDNAMSQNATTIALATKADIEDLSNVAFSGLYSDLTGVPTSLPASDVYSWAKQPTKPTYTSAEVGLGNVPNVNTNNQTPTWTISSTLANLVSGETLTVAFGKIAKCIQTLISHIANVSNPHNVTKAQVELGNADNTADSAKNVLSATKLTTSRTINGVLFNGTANISTPLGGSSDVAITSPVNKQVLQYNGTEWVNEAVPTGATSLGDLTDVTLTSPTNSQILQYNGTDWINSTLPSVDVANAVKNQQNPTTSLKMWSGTLAQYNAITTKDATTVYMIV